MNAARYPLHKLIQDLMASPAAAAAFVDNPERFFDDHGLTEEERVLLRDGSPSALHRLGIHPNLQMKYTRIRAGGAPPPPATGPIAAYLDRLLAL